MAKKKTRNPLSTAPTASVPERPPSALEQKLGEWGRRPHAYAVVSLLLLLPCFWQSRIQAGDLSSHIYNSWLAQLVGQSKLPGLAVAHQFTNVLFDLLLAGLFQLVGAGAAQRIAVAVAVLVFAWGVFAWSSVVSGTRPWHIMPVVAVLAYSWVFHMGFFGFYLSLGLCFWVLFLVWDWQPRKMLGAAILLAVAWSSHALPVLWTLAVVAYYWVARDRTVRVRWYLTAAAVVAVPIVHGFLSSAFTTRWFPLQRILFTGVDQLWIYDGKYGFPALCLLAVFVLWLAELGRRWGGEKLLASIPLHFAVITAAGVVMLPDMVLLPGYRHALAYIADRMSLVVALSLCGVLASARPRLLERGLLVGVMLVYFGFLFRDDLRINAWEDRLEAAVQKLPPGVRVVNAIDTQGLHVDPVVHMIDRLCIGRCYSYANYEPATAQFRVRVTADNPYVVSTYEDSIRLQTGQYLVKPRDVPLYQLNLDRGGEIMILQLAAGTPARSTYIDVLE